MVSLTLLASWSQLSLSLGLFVEAQNRKNDGDDRQKENCMDCAEDRDDVPLLERAIMRITWRTRRAEDVRCQIQDERDNSNQKEEEVDKCDHENSQTTMTAGRTKVVEMLHEAFGCS